MHHPASTVISLFVLFRWSKKKKHLGTFGVSFGVRFPGELMFLLLFFHCHLVRTFLQVKTALARGCLELNVLLRKESFTTIV